MQGFGFGGAFQMQQMQQMQMMQEPQMQTLGPQEEMALQIQLQDLNPTAVIPQWLPVKRISHTLQRTKLMGPELDKQDRY